MRDAVRAAVSGRPGDRFAAASGAGVYLNVLVAAGLPPAVIDVSPYWRPPSFAEGVVVADALCWHEAGPDLLDRAGVPVGAVARALLFRMATTAEVARGTASGGVDLRGEARRYAQAATAIGL